MNSNCGSDCTVDFANLYSSTLPSLSRQYTPTHGRRITSSTETFYFNKKWYDFVTVKGFDHVIGACIFEPCRTNFEEELTSDIFAVAPNSADVEAEEKRYATSCSDWESVNEKTKLFTTIKFFC